MPEDLSFDDTWFSARESIAGAPATIRARRNLQSIAGLASHPELLLIRWPYEPDPVGQPPEPERERMDAFERAVVDELEMDWLVIFFCVATHDGRREWMGYCSDVDEAADRLNDALADHPPYPIELVSTSDPDWTEYADVAGE